MTLYGAQLLGHPVYTGYLWIRDKNIIIDPTF